MPLPLIRKLRHYTRFSPEEEQELEHICVRRRRPIPAREDVISEGARIEDITVMESGWAARYRVLEDGRRQIMALLLPGDILDLDAPVLERIDHPITAITPVVVGEIGREAVDALFATPSRLRQALQWQQYVQSAIQREWAVSLGQRTAFERMAHFMCETFTRLQMVDLTDGNSCEFPLTQIELGEVLGLSSVHVNRVLQDLRGQHLISLSGRTLTVSLFADLATAGLFDPLYLHIDRPARFIDALG